MARKKRKKRKVVENKSLNGNPAIAPARKRSINLKDEFYYKDLLPDELITIEPLIKDYFTFNKHPWEPVMSQEKFQKQFDGMKNSIIVNPMYGYVGKVFAGYDIEPDLPLNIIGEAKGYIWFYIARDMENQPYLFIEHLYTIPELRNMIRFHYDLEKIATDYAKRAGTKRILIDARSIKRQKQWAKYGFKVLSVRMEFEGSIEDLEQGYWGKVVNFIDRKVHKWEEVKVNQQSQKLKQY